MRDSLPATLLIGTGSVEDRPPSLTQPLRAAGHWVLQAAGGADTLRLARSAQPELILLGPKAPGFDPLALTQRLRAEPAAAAFGVLQLDGGRADFKAHARALSNGAHGFLLLPCAPSVLLATVRALLRRVRQEHLLQQALTARDELLATVSHDLRTPLSAMRLSLQLIERMLAGQEELRRALAAPLARVTRQTDRALALIGDLLDVSQLGAGALNLQLQAVDLTAVLQDALRDFEQEREQSGSRIDLQLEPGVIGYWDRARLEQIAGNLISNAIKYGAGRPISISVRRVDEHALLTVRDQGIGIPPAVRARIFQRFDRAGQQRRTGSYGLGLWIVKTLLEAMGGQIRLHSVPGAGTSFTVSMPLGRRADGSLRPTQPPVSA